jgi:GNAT superfamily N-acetyltransferase
VGRRSKYPEEFRQRAAQLVLDSRRSVRNVAGELEVNHETLRNWVAAERRQRADGPTARRLLAALADHYVSTYGAHDLEVDDPADYAPPAGGCLLLVEDGQPVAVGCWRRHGPSVCELRRFYVTPAARGRRGARRMLEAALTAARAAGYERAVCAVCATEIGEGLAGTPGLEVRRIAPFGPHSDAPGVGYFEVLAARQTQPRSTTDIQEGGPGWLSPTRLCGARPRGC